LFAVEGLIIIFFLSLSYSRNGGTEMSVTVGGGRGDLERGGGKVGWREDGKMCVCQGGSWAQ